MKPPAVAGVKDNMDPAHPAKFDVECMLISLHTNALQWRGRFSEFWLDNASQISLTDIELAATRVHVWQSWVMPGGAAGNFVLVPIGIPIDQLERAWSTKAEEFPTCAVCSLKIQGEDDQGEIVPVRLFRKDGAQALALHPLCFQCLKISPVPTVKPPTS